MKSTKITTIFDRLMSILQKQPLLEQMGRKEEREQPKTARKPGRRRKRGHG